MNKIRSKCNLILTLVLIALVAGNLAHLQLHPEVHSYEITIIERASIYAVAAVAMNLLIGYTGQFSLGSAGFMCIGAYVTGALTIPVESRDRIYYLYGVAGWLRDLQLNIFVALIVSALLCAVAAAIIGWPVLRLKSDYLAIATLGFAEIITAVFSWDGLGSITNASYGITGIPQFASLLHCVGSCTVCIAIMALLVHSSYGRAFKAVRDDEIAAEAMGINLFHTKELAFVVSSAFSGIAGGMLAVYMRSASTSTFTISLTYSILLMVVIGGVGTISGSILGAFLVSCSQEALRFLDQSYTFGELLPSLAGTSFGDMNVPLLRNGFRMVVFSILLMVIVLFWQKGLTGGKELSWDRLIDGIKGIGHRRDRHE